MLAPDGPSGLGMLKEKHVDLVLLDMIMPRMNGIEVLDEIVRLDSFVPVIVVTANKSVSTAVEAIKHGACEYIIKPFDVDEILLMVEKALLAYQKDHELSMRRNADASGFDAIVGNSPALKQTIALAQRAAQVNSTVLITGGSGTGKDLMARAIHTAGQRANDPFVAVSCCAIPEQLVESELFGHEKGSFTGATEKRIGKMQVADKGTLFLDEIGEMPLEAQSKLLRVLQGGQFYPVGSTKIIEVDIRFICATNRDLREAVKQGIFREDLFYRVNVLHIDMPGLRNRREDIPALVHHFVAKHRSRVNAQVKRFAPDAMAMMVSYDWPGNIRELENMVERILVMNNTVEELRAEHLAGIVRVSAPSSASGLDDYEGLPLEEATRRLERRMILRALEHCDNVQSRAAEALGTTRRILKYKMDQLGIESVEREAG
jgi:two-component system NtrC family response regulator